MEESEAQLQGCFGFQNLTPTCQSLQMPMPSASVCSRCRTECMGGMAVKAILRGRGEGSPHTRAFCRSLRWGRAWRYSCCHTPRRPFFIPDGKLFREPDCISTHGTSQIQQCLCSAGEKGDDCVDIPEHILLGIIMHHALKQAGNIRVTDHVHLILGRQLGQD